MLQQVLCTKGNHARMASRKLLVALFTSLSIAVAVVMAFGAFMTDGAHAAGVKLSGTPHYAHFTHNFSNAATSKSALKTWSSSFTYQGQKYSYTMVGTNPAKGSKTTKIPVTIVPIKVTFSGGTTLDGTTKVQNTTSSPLFVKAKFLGGKTQYTDAIQRTEFWKTVSKKAPKYHVLLGTPTVTPTVSLTVPAADGVSGTAGNGSTIGEIDINWWDAQLQPMLTSMHFTPGMLPIFLTYNVFLYSGSTSNCCIIGYHSAVQNSAGLQTYAWASNNDPGIFTVQIEDINALSHELSEWMNDPFTNNVVPNWSVPSEPQYGCSNSLEVGDPLVGVAFTVNGYHPQDEAFFSWFSRQSPSIAFKGRYSYLGTFTTYSPSC